MELTYQFMCKLKNSIIELFHYNLVQENQKRKSKLIRMLSQDQKLIVKDRLETQK